MLSTPPQPALALPTVNARWCLDPLRCEDEALLELGVSDPRLLLRKGLAAAVREIPWNLPLRLLLLFPLFFLLFSLFLYLLLLLFVLLAELVLPLLCRLFLPPLWGSSKYSSSIVLGMMHGFALERRRFAVCTAGSGCKAGDA